MYGDTKVLCITERAAMHFQRLIARRDPPGVFRLSLRDSGCSGFRYVPEIVDQPMGGDWISEQQGVTLCVAREDIPKLIGTTVDYVTKDLGWRLVFRNPHAEDVCGCGESFNLKNDVDTEPNTVEDQQGV